MSILAPQILPPSQIQYNNRRIKNHTVVRFRLGHNHKFDRFAPDLRPIGQWHKFASPNEQQSVVTKNMEHKKLTLMFTDIVGYSRLMGRDETTAIELLGEYRRILLARIEEHRGTLIEFAGDAIFARFDCPIAAVQAAVAIQKDLAEFNREQEKGMPLLQSRIGIHAGEVALKGSAVFGDDVNIAARLEPIAVADGICVSREVYRAVKDIVKEPVLSLGKQPLKNIENKIRVYLIRPAGITLGTHAHYFWRTFQQKLGAYRYPIAASILLLIAAGVYFIPRWLVPGYTANYVEIADFQNLMNEGGEADYFSAGVTEALRAQLADIRDVYILDADEGVRAPIRLEGSVQKLGENLRIAYRLFRRKDNVQIAGGKLDGAYNDIFILQDRVVAEIAGYLAEEFGLQNFRPAALKLTSDVTAYDYYLQGLDYSKRPSSHENIDTAIKMYSTALVHDSSFALANTGLCMSYAKKYDITLVNTWIKQAESYCNLALQQDDSLSETYEALGRIYRDTGRSEDAVRILTKAIEYDPENVDAMIKLANTYRLQSNDLLAEEMFKKAVSNEPRYWRSYQELATFYARKGELEKAIRTYRKVLSITPENSLAYTNMATAYTYLGEFDKAADAFDQSVTLRPTAIGYANAGWMNFLRKDYKEAAIMYKEAVRLSPQDYKWQLGLADSLRQIPDHSDEADKFYRRVIDLALPGLQINPRDLDAYQNLALSHLALGETSNAEEYLNSAFRINADDMYNHYINLRLQMAKENYDAAYTALGSLITAGYPSFFVEADPDLSTLKEQPLYKSMLVASNVEK